VSNLYHFFKQSKWEDDGIFRLFQEEAAGLLSCEDGMLTADGTDLPKKGSNSFGVETQRCGTCNNNSKCKAAIYVGYNSVKGILLLTMIFTCRRSDLAKNMK
jgi:SRSO17 transposase